MEVDTMIENAKVDREYAIIMASGLGTRMRPLTERVPKPLLKVSGKPMIETVIEGLIKRDIAQIAVVVGYLKEQFQYLEENYPCIKLIENPDYETVNNLSSVYYAREFLTKGACFICEADLYIRDVSVFEKELKESGYYGKMVYGKSDDWVFEQDQMGRVTRVGKVGTDCYNMVGISFFTKQDAWKLEQVIKESYGTAGYEIKFWDDIVNEHLDLLKLKVFPIQAGQIVEIDTIDEWKEVNKQLTITMDHME